MRKIVCLIICIAIICAAFIGCTDQASIVSANISKEADNFNVVRRITVINCIQGDILFVMEGKMSIETTSEKLYIIVEDGDGTYKKHIIGLSDNVTYTLEDLSSNYIDRYNYTINYNPKMWIPWDIHTVD